MAWSHSNKAMKLALAVAVSGVALAACSSSSSGRPRAASKSTATSNVVTSAQKQIDKYLGQPAFTPPGPAVNPAAIKGKTIVVLSFSLSDSALLAVDHGIQAAGQVLGAKVQVDNAQNTPSLLVQDMQSAISEHAAAVIPVGTPPIPAAVAQAAAAHIPVVGALQANPSTSAPGQGSGANYFGSASGSYKLDGELMADTAIVRSKGKPVKAVVEGFGGFPVSSAVVAGIKKVFASCSFCSIVSTHSIQPVDWATTVAPTTAAAIRVTPGTNWVFTTVDSMAPFAVSGIQTAGLASSVSVASGDGSGAGPLGLVKNGGPFKADPGYNVGWVGWLAMYQAARAIEGKTPGNPTVPSRYLDRSNLSGIGNLNSQGAIYGKGYVSGFDRLFGAK